MSSITPVMPRQSAPALDVATVGSGNWSLADQSPENFTMVVFYRGLHCPKCKLSLTELNRKAGDFAELGVGIIAVSCDEEDRARTARDDWKLENLTIGYGLSIEDARAWGLYISTSNGVTSIGVEEPALFCEPGLFVIQSDGNLYMTAIQSMPFARPLFAEVAPAIKFVLEKGYPARGEA